MKSLIKLSLIASALCFGSCSMQDEEDIYSCDPEINAWVTDNLTDIRQMSRADWLELDNGLQRDVFVAFTSEQKQMFWQDKLLEVLTLAWNDAEKTHIKSLYHAVLDHPNWFSSDRTNEDFEEYRNFSSAWATSAEQEFGWSKGLIIAIAIDGNKLISKSGEMEVKRLVPRLKFLSEKKCTCNQMDNWCSNRRACRTISGSPCESSSFGCGLLYITPCNGECLNP